MTTLYDRQLELEEKYSTASLIAGQQQVVDAFKQGRASDLGSGRVVLAVAFKQALEDFTRWVDKPTVGIGGKYKKLLRLAPPDVIVMAGLREVINGCASPEPIKMQSFMTQLGRIIESECMLACMDKVSATYTTRTVEYLDSAGTKSTSHRYRTFLKGAQNIGLAWEQWSTEERTGVARLLLTILYETGLFKWTRNQFDSTSVYILEPTETLAKNFQDTQAAARAIVKYPPMLIPPLDWTGYNEGGYYTDWFRIHSPMCGIRYIKPEHKNWIINALNGPESQPVRDAMNKAQSVPYRVNQRVLTILRTATAMRIGILGLPSFVPAPKPDFPFQDGWLKESATAAELEQFNFWKTQMAAWYTNEAKRKGRHMGILGRINELVEYQTEKRLYFPTFIDWRGRLYFRSNLNPQSSDAVKGCLEFAEGKPLGKQGLKWLKVHVANCCGYDKHDADTKEKWCDENWEQIKDFINNPLDVDAPEPDTAFTLLQAGLALQEALSMPCGGINYVCHVPIAMDATCSGLQHLSALTRDPVGSYYTNLINNKSDQKSDIYMRVAEVARQLLPNFISDVVIEQFWNEHEISRSMAKNPVMTYVYGATLLRCIDTIAMNLADSGVDPIMEGKKVLYSITALATPVGKALRKGVEETVPESAKMMKYLQKVVRGNDEHCMRWFTPVGVPVVNWAEGSIIKRLNIRSMGVDMITMKVGDKNYNTRIASNGIVPNFVHSMDSAHLCMTINDFKGAILPIHDSFATHACDVDGMHESLRNTFVDMYSQFKIEDFLTFNEIDLETYEVPPQGNLDLETVKDSPFMFC